MLNYTSYLFSPDAVLTNMLREMNISHIIRGEDFKNRAYIAAIMGEENIRNNKILDKHKAIPLYIRNFPF